MNSLFNKIYETLTLNNGYQLILTGIVNTLLMSIFAVFIGIGLGFIIALTKVYAHKNKLLN